MRVVYPSGKVENGSFVSANRTQIFIQKRISTVIMNKCCKIRINFALFISGISRRIVYLPNILNYNITERPTVLLQIPSVYGTCLSRSGAHTHSR